MVLKDKQKGKIKTVQLPPIPEKLYFSIGEVAKMCAVETHVLRYWEQEFPMIAPSKRRGNRRYYKTGDVIIIRKIRSLLYEQGFTIDGARRQLSQSDKKSTVSPKLSVAPVLESLHKILKDLETA
jgi:DNA-binding transcriptional MerR regulator